MKTCPKCGERFPDDANFCPMDASGLRAETPPQVVVSAGTTLGTYRLKERREARASGEVWGAADGAGAQVQVMLVAKTVFPSPLGLERAQRELRQLQRVTTPGVAKIIDLGRTEDGRLYVVTEALKGPTLRAVVARDGRMPLARACRVVLDLGEALAEAQKVGVVHRDVNPDNVVLEGEQVKVLNFSVAEPVTDQVFGNPTFLSPEQASGKPPDQRSNIYSLGALLYYLVAGQPPFEGDAKQLLDQAQNMEPLPLSKRASKVPAQADVLLHKAMAKNPGRRHLTMRQFLKEVSELAEASSPTGEAPKLEAPKAEAELGNARTMAVISQPPAAVATPVVPKIASPSPRAPSPAPVAAPAVAAAAPLVAPPLGAAAAKVAGTLGEGKAVVAAQQPEAARIPPQARPAPAAGKAFRETMWFFKGEVASQQAATGATGEDAPTSVLEDDKPIDDKYRDDGTLEAAGGSKLSLKTGHTMAMKAVKIPKPIATGDKMTEEEFLNEMATKGRMRSYMVMGVIGALGMGVLAWLLFF